jgi:hypothetical protein
MRNAELGMATLLKWKQPKAVEQEEWCEAGPQMKQMLRCWFKWWIPLAPLTVYLVSRIDPTSTWRTAQCLAEGILVFPLWFYAMIRLQRLMSTWYEIGDKMIVGRSGSSSRGYRWSQVEAFRISSRDDLPGIRFFEFKVKGLKRWNRWGFNPSEVDESRLRAILDEHLPGKCWDNVTG